MNLDPASFLDLQVTGANDTKLVPIPVGEYLGITGEAEVTAWASKDDPTKSGLKVSMMISIEDDTAKAVTGRDKLTVKYDCMLDIMPDGKSLDMGKGKNVGLGRLREALNLNDPSEPFSFRKLSGRPLKVMIGHREYKGDFFADVKAVTRA